MKNFFPLILLGVIFTGFLASQIIFDVFTPSAQYRSQEKSRYAYFSQELKSHIFKTTKSNEFNFSLDKTPIIVFNFWASWCLPCLEEMPELVKLQNAFPREKLKIIGVNTDEVDQLKNIEKIEKKFNLNFESVADQSGKLMNTFNVANLPVTIIFHNGEAVEYFEGSISSQIKSGELLSNLEARLRNQNP